MIKKVIVVDEVLESLLLYGFSPALISWTVAIRADAISAELSPASLAMS
jgi:hypothetical protein